QQNQGESPEAPLKGGDAIRRRRTKFDGKTQPVGKNPPRRRDGQVARQKTEPKLLSLSLHGFRDRSRRKAASRRECRLQPESCRNRQGLYQFVPRVSTPGPDTQQPAQKRGRPLAILDCA